jgi:hypothetical protein
MILALIIVFGGAREADRPERGFSLAVRAQGAATPSVEDRCPTCAKYSNPRFRIYVQGLEPRVSLSMTSRVRMKLLPAFDLAKKRICEVHECHHLFSQLDADGIEALAVTYYLSANEYREHRICRRAAAFTNVGGIGAWLCRSFSRVSDKYAAMVLIHEALHCSGLEEEDQRGTSAGHNTTVRRACNL